METLLLKPTVETKAVSSWDEAIAGIRGVAPQASFLAAEIDGGKCIPVASLDPAKSLALGSAFKLYVLAALAADVAAGKHRWEDAVPIQDALKSLPSGAMRDEPAQKTFSVRHFAEQMISVSDNTAADHLLALVGRGAVEEAVKASGHADPARNQPFLTTRELFALKLLAPPEDRTAYVAADVAHRRKLLEGYDARDLAPTTAQAASFTKPVMIDSLEWFASPEDLCNLMVGLEARAGAPETAPVGTILAINPGIPDDAKQWSYVGFKGGSEPGVMNLTWLLRRARDGKWLFMSAGFNDTARPIDEGKALAAVAAARAFLGR
jgi:beta-lactamase class A